MAKLGSRASFGGTVVENITAAKTLDPSDSGKVFTIDQDSAFSITLPTAAQAGPGWTARFIMTDIGSNDVKIIPNSSEDTLIGMITAADGGAAESAESGVDELVFASGNSGAGDWAELICDGSNFYVSGQEHDADGMTIS
jgi:hypothetical protein